MANTKTTIELNGTLYDAVTGKPVVASRQQASQAKPSSQKPIAKPQAIDGFMPTSAKAVKPVPKLAPKPTPTRTTTNTSARSRQPERSKTLMRHATPRPSVPKPQPTASAKKHSSGSVSPGTIHEARKERAKQVAKSPAISRFGNGTAHKVDRKIVKNMPVQTPSRPTTSHTKPAPAEPPKIAVARATAQPAKLSFTEAMARAKSHEQPKVAKPKLHQRTARKLGVGNRVVSFGAGALAVLLLVGFIAYQNIPNLQMRLAATRAGFSAALPATPAGFSMSDRIEASQGQITVNFRSNSDDRAYQVTQKESDWTSTALLDNYVVANKLPYQIYEDKGKTIYLYDGSNATWVNGGIWYEIKGSSSLNTDQLVQIANSF